MNPERWQRIKDLAAAAFELQGDARTRFLDKECGSDLELRRAVEVFLEGDERPGDTVERAIAGAAAQLSQNPGSRRLDAGPGQTISHYSVIEKLGEGGMGVVYRAEDTKLKRPVALKFLRSDLLEDSEHKARFLREAQAAASLIHSNICVIHEIDESQGSPFIAMEFVEGETVKQKVKARPLKLDEALDIAIQTAQGLQAAHEKGIVHRDIKSANLMVTPQGQVKIMDFGLAQLAERSQLTKTATILGTPAYMSPEQTRRERTDSRTDIWSLGVVIYEMVTGRLPFEGERQEAVLYGIANENPEPVTALRAGLPMELEWIVSKAMAKDAAERYQHVEEMVVDLRGLRKRTATGDVRPARPRQTAHQSVLETRSAGAPRSSERKSEKSTVWRQALPWAVAVVGVFAAVWTRVGDLSSPLVRRQIVRSVVTLPPDHQFNLDITGASVAISPGGASFVYVAKQGENTKIFLRRMDQFEVRPLPGTEGASNPFFSPDGEWVGFFAGSALWKVAVGGGTPVKVSEVPAGGIAFFEGSWESDDRILFDTPGGGIMRVAASGGTPKLLTSPNYERGEQQHRAPASLPDGAGFFFVVRMVNRDQRLAIFSYDTGEWSLLGEVGQADWARYLPSGHLLYSRLGQVFAVGFDLPRREIVSSPSSLPDQVFQVMGRVPALSVSDSGTLVYIPSTESAYTLVWVDRSGQATSMTRGIRGSRHPRLSPDGRFLAEAGDGDVWVLDIERGTRIRLTDRGGNYVPAWTPDGARLAFTTLLPGTDWNIHWAAADGGGDVEPLYASEYTDFPTSWSSESPHLALAQQHSETGWDIQVLPMGEQVGEPTPFLKTDFNEFDAKFSPNGRWIAYVSDESGRNEIYVRPYPGPGGKTTISTGGGIEPLWSRDGRELFFRNGGQMLAVGILSSGSEFRAGQPRMLFEGRYEISPVPATSYDVSQDGKRFLMVRAEQSNIADHVRLVQNFTEELERVAPQSE